MKAVFLLCALVVVISARPEEQYTNKYDNLDIMEILNNKRLLHPYIKCGLDKIKCTAEGKELKSHLKEGLETYCAKCTDRQREVVRLVIKHLIHHEPQYWRELSVKYDHDGKFTAKYEKELKTIIA